MQNAFEWSEEYSVKIEEIDNQHKRFLKLIHELFILFTKINQQKTEGKGELKNILQELIDYADYHFATEEKYFTKFSYINTEEHKKEHRDFKSKIKDLQSKYSENEIEVSFELIDFLEDWLLEHIAYTDQQYTECFHENGLK